MCCESEFLLVACYVWLEARVAAAGAAAERVPERLLAAVSLAHLRLD